MARPGVTREQVFEAAERLVQRGENPTVVAVRTELGGGSPNTVAPWLAEWKAQYETQKPEVLPPLPEPVESAMRQVWGVAWKGAQEQLEGEREALLKARESIVKERDQMLDEITRQDTALEQAQGETRRTAESLEAERKAHDGTRAEVREARVLTEERGRRIEDQDNELRELRRQLGEATSKAARLEGESSGLRASLSSAHTEIEQLKETQRQAKSALDLGAKKITELEAALAEERKLRTEELRQLVEGLRRSPSSDVGG